MIHHVYANKSNIGDWLSARGIQSLLAPFSVVEHLCDRPFIDETLLRLSEATPRDLVVIGGGGLFMDYFTPFWEGFLRVAKRVPFCIWGVGFCDLKREPSRACTALLEDVASMSRFTVVRDQLTREYLSRCALPPPVPCPSTVAVEPAPQEGWGILHSANYTTAGAEVYEFMCARAREFAAQTGRRYRETNNRIPDESEKALAEVLDRYRKSDLVISSRLHGCIIALALGRKVLAVSGDRKVESFMKAMGLERWVCDLEDVNSVPERLRKLPEQPVPVDCLRAAQRDNLAVATRVRALLGALP